MASPLRRFSSRQVEETAHVVFDSTRDDGDAYRDYDDYDDRDGNGFWRHFQTPRENETAQADCCVRCRGRSIAAPPYLAGLGTGESVS